MGPLKRKSRYAQMIELRPLPAYLVMAAFAIGREPQIKMRRISGAIISSLMAGHTKCRRTGKGLRMALAAIYQRMGAPQGEGGGMLEIDLPPTRRVGLMTGLAVETKPGQHVIGIGRVVIAIDMAALTNCRRAGELILPLAHMAGIAINHGMHSKQGETVFKVSGQDIFTILPGFRCMAGLAIDPELPAMNIRMTISAIDSDMRKDERFMTLRT